MKPYLLIWGVGEDSWESLGLQGDPTHPSWRRSVLGVHWRDWCWSWNSNTLATWREELTHWKNPDAGRDWGQEEKGTTEDDMVGWHHQLNGYGFGWTLGGLACCDSWGHRVGHDWVTELNWTEDLELSFTKLTLCGEPSAFSMVKPQLWWFLCPYPQWTWCRDRS